MGESVETVPRQAKAVEIVEVGPRDGLQNEARLLTTDQKVEFVRRAVAAGVRRIEVASFVHPGRVPQMADAEQVVAALPPRDDVVYIGLVLNKRGALRALESGIAELGAVCSASEAFGQRNQGQSIAQSIDVAADVVRLARTMGRRAQITITTAFGCPFDGEVPHDRVIALARRAADAGATEVSLGDTIGVAGPGEVEALVRRLAAEIAPVPVRVHFHNTRNTGLANVWAAIGAGAVTVDSSIGGIGGCPFAPAATGNVPTEDVAYMLARSGVATGLDLDRLLDAAHWLSGAMERALPAMLGRAGLFPSRAVAA